MCGVAGILLLSTNCRFTISGGYSFDYQGVETERTESGEIPGNVTAVFVENRFGDVKIERTNEKPSWSWSGACWATAAEDSELFLQELKISVTTTGSKQYWKVELPERDSKLRGVRSDLTLLVPASVVVSTENRHGDTAVQKISGKVKIRNEHGNITTNELLGEVQIDSEHGNVVANALASKTKITNEHGNISVTGAHGHLTLRGEHGDVNVENAGAVINVDVEHGDIVASGLQDDIKFDNEHGSVRLNYVSNQFKSIAGSAEHSNVKIYLPETCKPKISVSVEHGRINSDVKNHDQSDQKIKVSAEHTNVKIAYE